jgi:hypothetical protein
MQTRVVDKAIRISLGPIFDRLTPTPGVHQRGEGILREINRLTDDNITSPGINATSRL